MKHSPLWSLSLVLVASACLKDTSAPSVEIPPISRIAVTPASTSLLVGKSTTFAAMVTGGTGKEAITWSLDNSAVGSISTSGVFSAKAVGSAIVKVQVDTFSVTAAVSVLPAGLNLSPGAVTLPLGQTVQLKADVLDGLGGSTPVTWSFSNASAGFVSSSGFFTARGSGTGIVTVAAPGDLKATATVTVTPSGITASPTTLNLQVGKTAQLRASVADGTGAASAVSWFISDASVGTVSSSGLFTATGSGDANITASAASGAISTSAAVHVSPTSITVTPGTAVLTIGSTKQFAAAVSDGTGAASVVQWTFSDPLIGSVASTGLFTAKGTGFGTLFANGSGLTASAAISVTPTGVNITRGSDSLIVGRTQQYFADVNDGTGRTSTVRWSFSNLNVATISEAGILTSLAPGTGKVTASAGGAANSVDLTITAGAVDRVTVCDRSATGCASVVTLAAVNSVASVRASAFNSLGADISSSCSFSYSAQTSGIVSINLSTDASHRDALVTRVATGTVQILVTCSANTAVLTIN